MPTYAEIRLAVFPGRSVRRELDAFDPDCVHVATEGTLGLAARNYCRRRRLPFTTAYHTQFPEYVRARVPIPIDVITSGKVGVLDADLHEACRRALTLDRNDCRALVEKRSWRQSTLQFERYLAPRTRATAAAQPDSSASR